MSSSPIDNVDWQYVVGEVALLRTAEPIRVCLLVEGRDDAVVYKHLVNKSYCQIIICYGKENLLLAIDALNRQQFVRGYLGVKDADFDVVYSIPPKSNLLLTDGHDLEMMICSSEALDKLVEVRLRGEDSNFTDAIKRELREKSLEVSSVLGYLRWIARKCIWGVDIHTFRVLNCLTEELYLPLDDSILEVKSIHPHIDETKCDHQEFVTLKAQYMKHLCHGHELVTVISVLFPRIVKKHLSKKANPGGEIADNLFMGYDFAMFKMTSLYAEMLDWERNNLPFKIFTD